MPRNSLPNRCFTTQPNHPLSRVHMTCTKRCALAAGCFRARRLCCVAPLAPSRPVLAAPKPPHSKPKVGHSRRNGWLIYDRLSGSEFCRPNVVGPAAYLAIYWKIGRRSSCLNSRSLLNPAVLDRAAASLSPWLGTRNLRAFGSSVIMRSSTSNAEALLSTFSSDFCIDADTELLKRISHVPE